MRTDVKVGVALLAVVLIIAVSYFGTKKKPDEVQLADGADKVRDQNAKTLDGMLSSPGRSAADDKNKKSGPGAAGSNPPAQTAQRPRPRPQNAPTTPGSTPDNRQAARTNPNKPPVRPSQTSPDSSANSTQQSALNTNKPAAGQSGPNLEQSSLTPARPPQAGAAGPGAPGATGSLPASAAQDPGLSAPSSSSPGATGPDARSGPASAVQDPGPAAPGATGPSLSGPAGATTPLGGPASATTPFGGPASAVQGPGPAAPGLPPLKSQPPGATGPGAPGPASALANQSLTPPPEAPRTHVIVSGDSFAKLAERYYGSQKHARVLLAANPTVDPKSMKIGATINIPPLAEATSQKPQTQQPAARSLQPEARIHGQRDYTVQDGDTLYTIAEKHLGSPTRWPEIYELNKQDVGNDPMTLHVGRVILLPSR